MSFYVTLVSRPALTAVAAVCVDTLGSLSTSNKLALIYVQLTLPPCWYNHVLGQQPFFLILNVWKKYLGCCCMYVSSNDVISALALIVVWAPAAEGVHQVLADGVIATWLGGAVVNPVAQFT